MNHRRYSGSMADLLLGSLPADRQRLAETSPPPQATRIDVPVLLLAGATSYSYDEEQTDLMADALKAAGKRYRLVNLRDHDNYVWGYQDHLGNDARGMSEMEKFLGEVLENK